MAITIIEVARLAGVSKSTAARALAGKPGVSEAVRERVTAAAKELGYRTNMMASALRAGESRLLGLLVTNLGSASVQAITEVLQARARSEGYQVLLGVTGGDAERELAILDTLIDHRVDGVILMGTGQNNDHINDLAGTGLPIVNLIRRSPGTRTPAVLPDNYHGTYEAARYLIGLGHRSIATIGGPADVLSGYERFAGFQSALSEAGIELDPELVQRGPFDLNFGYIATVELLDGCLPFTALLVTNHEAMFGVLSALTERGVAIPDELSLVGFEDFHWFSHWRPPVTVVDVDPAALAHTTIDVLLEQIRKKSECGGPIVERTSARLVIRESCKPL